MMRLVEITNLFTSLSMLFIFSARGTTGHTDNPSLRVAPNVPECTMKYPAGMQWDVFYGPEFNVVSTFCEELQNGGAGGLFLTVNTTGYIQQHRTIRSPPVSPSTYKGYRIRLGWIPYIPFDSEKCLMDCLEAYRDIARGPCGHTGGTGNIMAKNGTWNVGCGEYSWGITRP
ncbi:uncharacterized protein CTRU02_215645 [Colletotrichum truncatum]|uniref:Uncharacterized protein n=1 Tax=Colletotrichum truncatum TaxID=5467 RepID=A0ACC3YCA1_COLTU|nr:uncharacterized protein CTRU02_05417 [Colletotrichum truncatum]KAF6793860.1 hypothetical protein CTRU02_05417 [Colletotrichum truncatum]